MANTVRPLGESDREVWEQLFRGYLEFYKATVADDVFPVTWQRLLSDEPGTHRGFVIGDQDPCHRSPG